MHQFKYQTLQSITSVCIISDVYLIVGLTTGAMTLMHRTTGAVVTRLCAHGAPITSIVYNNISNIIMSGAHDGSVHAWSVSIDSVKDEINITK
jgi:hypothetical protein